MKRRLKSILLIVVFLSPLFSLVGVVGYLAPNITSDMVSMSMDEGREGGHVERTATNTGGEGDSKGSR
jgi:hypothetical protein